MNSQNSIIEIADLSVNYGKNQALSNVNAVINSGDFVAITGPNGGGKSTLLKALLRLISPTTGAINYFRNGIPTDNLRFGYLPQKNNIDARFPITVEELVSLVGVISQEIGPGNPINTVGNAAAITFGLSVFHTIFNIINVLIMIWFTKSFVKICDFFIKPKKKDDEE